MPKSPLMLIIMATVLGGVGQVLIETGMRRVKYSLGISELTISQILLTVGKGSGIASPVIWLGFLIFGLSSILYLKVVSMKSIGYAYPFVAFNQVIVFLAMLFIFQQTPSFERTAGVSLICLGMLFVARGG